MYTRLLTFIAVLAIAGACKSESKPIIYGEDKCEFCRMSIVDQQFGCEVVTKKGKVFKFDAVECMVNYLDQKQLDESAYAMILTNAYDAPGKLIDATACNYLQSENMPSPMGMFLNPFENSDEAIKYQKQETGTIYDWQELRIAMASNDK